MLPLLSAPPPPAHQARQIRSAHRRDEPRAAHRGAAATLEAATRFRGSCGFLLVSVDHLGRLNEAYGFDATEEVIANVAKRIRAHLRGKDHLGRFSGNKFGVVLTSWPIAARPNG